MKTIILTVIITLLVLAASFEIYISSGAYDISQLNHHGTLTRWIINTTTSNSIEKRVKDINKPAGNNAEDLILGFEHYHEMCEGCHGAPGVKPMEMTEGLYPKPPEFYKSKDMPDEAEAYWIIKNGIKLTGMPAFGPTHDDKKIWAIADFLLNKMQMMSPQEYGAWVQKYAGEGEEDEDMHAHNE